VTRRNNNHPTTTAQGVGWMDGLMMLMMKTSSSEVQCGKDERKILLIIPGPDS
jgi:hypothetical protein